MKSILQKLAVANAELHTEERAIMNLMNETLDSYNAKKLTKKQMRGLMTNSSKLWIEINKEIVKSDALLEKYKKQ